eukprot:882077-Pyramimonas_sp.AAC.1
MGVTPLCKAALQGNTDVIKELVQFETLQVKSPTTLLNHRPRRCITVCVVSLQVNKPRADGSTALFIALCVRGLTSGEQVECVRGLTS